MNKTTALLWFALFLVAVASGCGDVTPINSLDRGAPDGAASGLDQTSDAVGPDGGSPRADAVVSDSTVSTSDVSPIEVMPEVQVSDPPCDVRILPDAACAGDKTRGTCDLHTGTEPALIPAWDCVATGGYQCVKTCD